jgi:phage terminase large subunit
MMKVLTKDQIRLLLNDKPNWSKLAKAKRDAIENQISTSLVLMDHSNDLFYPLFNDTSRFLVLMGGGGSGKSVFAADKIVHRSRTEAGHKWLIMRKVGINLRDSVFEEVKTSIEKLGYTPEFTIPKGRSSDLYIKHNKTGNEMLFYGADDIEKMKSISGVTDGWLEEASEFDVTDFRQINIRMRQACASYNQLLISFNPVNINHWLKSEFFDKSNLRIA